MSKPRYTVGAQRRRRKKKIMKPTILSLLCAVIILLALTIPDHCSESDPADSQHPVYNNLEYVVTNPTLDEQVVEYTGMRISFNPKLHVPNWVAYELTADEADGQEPRYKTFAPDPDVKGCATPEDYRNSGFDRGHMAPAADMKWDAEAMRESFYMTNIVPQSNTLNRGTWSKMEDKCRARARRDSAVIIVSGPVLTDPVEMHIGATGVVVPQRFFKVVLSPYTTPPTAIGFIVPNGYVKGGMQQCAVTVDEVERVTGHDFFSLLPDEIENQVESHKDFARWSRTK